MAKKKVSHGGRRPGSGRPTNPDGPTGKPCNFWMKNDVVEALSEFCETHKVLKGKVVDEALRKFLNLS